MTVGMIMSILGVSVVQIKEGTSTSRCMPHIRELTNTRDVHKSLGHLPGFCHWLCVLEFFLSLPRLNQTLLRTVLGQEVFIAHCQHLGYILSICPISASARTEH